MAATSRGVFDPGTRIDNFEIIRKIASGGMAELYLARAVGIGGFEKLVAIKVMVGDDVEDIADLFLDEARLVARLHHPNIVQVHGVGLEGDRYYQIMEYVDGIDARRLMRACADRAQPLRLDIALAIVRAVANALHYAHTLELEGAPLGIVHRDVSPSNILIGHDGWVKLADFGIATAANRHVRTKVGSVRGKPGYMSPEQCQGLIVDRRTDIFNLGIVLFELTTGRKLYRGDNDLALLHEIVYQDIQPPSLAMPGYLPELEKIVMRALARDVSRRYQSAAELADELDELARARSLEIQAIDPKDLAPLMPARGNAPPRPARAPTAATVVSPTPATPSRPRDESPEEYRAAAPRVATRGIAPISIAVAIALIVVAIAWYIPYRAGEPQNATSSPPPSSTAEPARAAAHLTPDAAASVPAPIASTSEPVGDSSVATSGPAPVPERPKRASAGTSTRGPRPQHQRPRPKRATKVRASSPEPPLPTDLKSPFPPAP